MNEIRAAIRFTLFVVSTLGIYSIWFLGSFVIPNKPFWRQVIFGLWARTFARIAGMTVEVIGQPPHAPFFLVSNHLSYTDIPAIRSVTDGVFVAKSEIEGWPLAGRIVRDIGTIFIDRKNRRDIPRAGGLIIDKLNGGEGVIVFPEGTSTKGEEVLPFNSSFLEFAARTDFPVYYSSITYKTPEGETAASDAVCWWQDNTFSEHLWNLFKVRSFTAIVNFGEQPVINTDRKQLARILREKVAEKFIPVI